MRNESLLIGVTEFCLNYLDDRAFIGVTNFKRKIVQRIYIDIFIYIYF